MFITRKRYEAELEKARMEGAEKAWQEHRTDRRFEEVYDRIENLAKAVSRLDDALHRPLCVEIGGDHRC